MHPLNVEGDTANFPVIHLFFIRPDIKHRHPPLPIGLLRIISNMIFPLRVCFAQNIYRMHTVSNIQSKIPSREKSIRSFDDF